MKYINQLTLNDINDDFFSLNLKNIKINYIFINRYFTKSDIEKYRKKIISNKLLIEAILRTSDISNFNFTVREILKTKSPFICLEYAKFIIRGRFIDGEPIILTDPKSSYYYAYKIIRGPWESSEKIISQDPKYSYSYARFIIKRPFLKGEKIIATDPHYSFLYALNVIGGPWSLGENSIMNSPENKDDYLYFLKINHFKTSHLRKKYP